MTKFATFAATVALLVCASGAFAAQSCTSEPKEKWMAEKDMKAKIDAAGYKVKRFLVSGTCYEIYGTDKAGKKVEIYFNPVDGSIAKQRGG